MDRLLNRIQRVLPVAFCSRDFFLLHDNAPAQKAAFPNFWPPQNLQPFITPRTLQIYLHQTIFCSPNWKCKLKGLHFADVAEIQEAVTDELKKVQTEEFSTAFQKLYDRMTVCQWSLFWIEKKVLFSSYVLFFLNLSPKNFVPHCVCAAMLSVQSSGFLHMNR